MSPPTRSARISSVPLTTSVAPITRSPGTPIDRNRFAAHHRLVNRGRPFNDDAVDRNLFAGPHAQDVANLNVGERNVLLTSVTHPSRGLRRQAEQFSNRGARAVPRAKLHHLTEQHEHGDHDSGVEVRLDRAAHLEPGRKDAGRQCRDHAVPVRGADAEADQREHVRAAVDERLPHALEERPATPQHDGRRQRQLDEVDSRHPDAVRQRPAGCHVAHRQQKHRSPEDDAHPEAARHVDELGIGRVRQIAGAADHGFERHAAFRARAGLIAHDLGVHGARISGGRRLAGLEARGLGSGWGWAFLSPPIVSSCAGGR